MGNANIKWANTSASNYLPFLTQLFGNPTYFIPESGGFAVWPSNTFYGKTLFGKPVCLNRIILRDETVVDAGVKNFMYIAVVVPVTSDLVCNMTGIAPGCMYDSTQQLLWVRCNSIDTGIATLQVLTNYAAGSTTLDQQPGQYTTVLQSVTGAPTLQDKITAVKGLYASVCTNLTTLSTNATAAASTAASASTAVVSEEFGDGDPWYGGSTPYYAMNNPGNVALGEMEDELYYRRLDEKPVMVGSLKPSKQAAAAASTTERLSGPSPLCKGACLDRYNKIFSGAKTVKTTEHYNPKAPLSTVQAFKLLQTRSNVNVGLEYLKNERAPLASLSAHQARLEGMNENIDNTNIFKAGSGSVPMMVFTTQSRQGTKKEYLAPSSPMTLEQAYKIFEPKPFMPREAMVSKSPALTAESAYVIFNPRKSVRLDYFH